MKALLLKDFYGFVHTNSSKVMIPFTVCMFGFCIYSVSATYASTMLCLIVMMQVLTSFGYDEQGGWKACVLAFPVKRSSIALEKYVFLALSAAACSIITLLCAGIDLMLGNPRIIETVALGCFVMLSVSTSMVVCTPLFFRYGVEKVRLATISTFFLPFIVLAAVSNLLGAPAMAATLSPLAIALYALVLLAGGIVSYRISKRIVERREP